MLSWLSPVAGQHTALLARAVLGLVLLIAGLAKIGNRRIMVNVVRAYQILPPGVAAIVGSLLPSIEIMIALSLLTGLLLPWSAYAASSLFVLFATAIVINLLRGRRDIACGCFGAASDDQLSWWLVGRNAILTGIAALIIVPYAAPKSANKQSFAETIVMFLVVVLSLALWWLGTKLVVLWRFATATRRQEG